MLPDAQDGPPRCLKGFGVASVAGYIALQLASPPIPVGYRTGGMVWAAVPEAAVDKDSEPNPRKDDIRLAADALNRTAVLPEPHARSVESRSQGDLRRRIPGPVGLHRASDPGSTRPRGHRRVRLAGCNRRFHRRSIVGRCGEGRETAQAQLQMPHPSWVSCSHFLRRTSVRIQYVGMMRPLG